METCEAWEVGCLMEEGWIRRLYWRDQLWLPANLISQKLKRRKFWFLCCGWQLMTPSGWLLRVVLVNGIEYEGHICLIFQVFDSSVAYYIILLSMLLLLLFINLIFLISNSGLCFYFLFILGLDMLKNEGCLIIWCSCDLIKSNFYRKRQTIGKLSWSAMHIWLVRIVTKVMSLCHLPGFLLR